MITENYALLVILPDSIRQGLIGSICDGLRKRKYRPLACRSMILNDWHVATLYSGNRSKTSEAGRQYGLPLTKRLVEMDSSIVILLEGDGKLDASKSLHDAKGASSPFEREKGTLRALSPLADRCLSLLHTPDNREEALRDIECLFAPLKITDLLAETWTYRPSWSDLENLRSYRDPCQELTRYDIVVRTIIRLSTALSVDASLALSEDFKRVSELCYQYLDHIGGGDIQQQSRCFGDLCRRLREGLDSFRPASNQEHAKSDDILSILWALASPKQYSLDLALATISTMMFLGYALTDFEQQRLVTALTFTPSGMLGEQS